MALDQTRANEVLTWMHAGSAPAALTSPIRIKLLTAIGTATSNGTELAAGGSYVQVSGATGGITTTWAAAASGSQATNAVAQQTNMPAATITSIELWDSAGTNKRVEFGALASSKTTSAGDTLSFASGAITSALA
jgi:hypothetical protein